VEIPDCTCDNSAAQWAAVIDLVKESSKVFVESRDTKVCWDLLAKLFQLPFFKLLKLMAPYSLLVRPSRETAAAKSRQIQDLPPGLQEELRKSEEILRHHANLVESHKATAKQAAKRKLLVFQQVDFALKEAKLERERQALEIKLRRTEETPVQYNWAQVPLAYAGVSGIARQTTSVSIATSRQELVRAAY
jgi:hypothetical protein